MKNVIGNEITITLFGESHGSVVGCVLDGLPSGFLIDMEKLQWDMEKRRAVGKISTGRTEADIPEIVSGLKDGYTEGTPLTILIHNTNVRSQDYSSISELARPGHADYAANVRYRGYQDPRGGGHFSARLTSALVAAGGILRQMLEKKGIKIGTHIQTLHGIKDEPLLEHNIEKTIDELNAKQFAVISDEIGYQMMDEIEKARDNQDSVGGILETVVIGVKAGLGEPTFDSIESRMAQALFSIPAVKGVEFGDGFAMADMYGHEANDEFTMYADGVRTITNHNGGINGGISNGMTIRYRTALKPTPSISRPQRTINMKKGENAIIEIKGRHDPAVVHRARAVVDAMSAFVLADMLASQYGRQWLAEEES